MIFTMNVVLPFVTDLQGGNDNVQKDLILQPVQGVRVIVTYIIIYTVKLCE